MGGTLVSRNQIGVDIRYANAGKWNEEHLQHTNGNVKVAGVNELQLNQMKLVHVNGKRIVICKTENGYMAFDDRCTHRGGSLASGSLICGTVQCPWHGSQFDVETGLAKAGPATEKIQVYKVDEIENELFINPDIT
jgi:nitrite reductase/ring-hydroxylating ferredoxin subunit